MKISVCIPTCGRLPLLKEAVASALAQSPAPHEILIGDDSSDNETESYITSWRRHAPGNIEYWHNQPRRGQAANVQALFERATGDVITLLHDDDRFCAKAFSALSAPFREIPGLVAAFGLQRIIADEGVFLPQVTTELNAAYGRTLENAGVVRNPYEAGVIAMFPNDGFFIRKDRALELGYNGGGSSGTACDWHFGFRVGQLREPLAFVYEPTSDYRLTRTSVARSGRETGPFYVVSILAKELESRALTRPMRTFLRRQVKGAIASGVNIDLRQSWRFFFSGWHLRSICSLGFFHRLAMLSRASLQSLAGRRTTDAKP